MITVEKAIKSVIDGEVPGEILEKAIAASSYYDPRSATNSSTSVQKGNVTTKVESLPELQSITSLGCNSSISKVTEDHGCIHKDPADYGSNPMAGTRMWPRGSHESLPTAGESFSFRIEDFINRVVKGEPVSSIFDAGPAVPATAPTNEDNTFTLRLSNNSKD